MVRPLASKPAPAAVARGAQAVAGAVQKGGSRLEEAVSESPLFEPARSVAKPLPTPEQLIAGGNVEQKVRVLRHLLGVPLEGQSANPLPLPVGKESQRRVCDLLGSVRNDPIAFGQLYYRVNDSRFRTSLTGKEKGEVQAMIAAHHASAKPGDWKGYEAYIDGVTGCRPVDGNELDFLMTEEVSAEVRHALLEAKSSDDGSVYPVPPDLAGSGNAEGLIREIKKGENIRRMLDELSPKARRALLRAKSSIHMSVYTLEPDTVGNGLADLLIRKAKKGVKVRLMVDEHGTLFTGRKAGSAELIQRLRDGGVEVVVNHSSRLRSHLDHRKLLVIDGEVGFTGGANIGAHFQGEWTDQQTCIRGPLAHELQRPFLAQWVQQGGRPPAGDEELFPDIPPLPSGETARVVCHRGGGQDRNIKAAIIRAIQTAEHDIKIAVPYFTDSDMVRELRQAAERGVKVTLYFPVENDMPLAKRVGEAFYRELMDAGVEIREVEGMSHLKVYMVDEYWCSFGSSNADPRSFEFNDELNCVVLSRTLAATVLEKCFKRQHARSSEAQAPSRLRLTTGLERRLGAII